MSEMDTSNVITELSAEPPGAGATRESLLKLIARGELAPTETHEEIRQETIILDILDFCLWYGPKQALFNNNIP
ncbi:MAG: phosphate ABC transporter ATP-binding protein, partial [Planctomycetota bacterium]|nr:phosphate ABC transporter ATP-binding protein [Planctomycetota bacterium]